MSRVGRTEREVDITSVEDLVVVYKDGTRAVDDISFAVKEGEFFEFLYLPLIFLSTAMFPVSFPPDWAQTASNYNPVTYIADVTRELVSGGFNLNTFVEGHALTGLIALVTLAATLYQFRRVVS